MFYEQNSSIGALRGNLGTSRVGHLESEAEGFIVCLVQSKIFPKKKTEDEKVQPYFLK